MNKMLLTIIAILGFIAISCGPSANPVLQQRLKDNFGRVSSNSFTANTDFKPMDYQIGQWIQLGNIDDKGRMSISKYAIVDRQSGGWVIETSSLNDYEETASQYLVKGMEKANETGDAGYIEIIWIKMRDKDGKVTNMEGPALSMFQGLYKNALKSMMNNITMTGATKDNVKVPAGSFSGASKVRTSTSFMGMNFATDAWFHNDVPINGMVKSVSTDGKYTTQLIDFGTSGAKSTF